VSSAEVLSEKQVALLGALQALNLPAPFDAPHKGAAKVSMTTLRVDAWETSSVIDFRTTCDEPKASTMSIVTITMGCPEIRC
jgi:hypothetical protein